MAEAASERLGHVQSIIQKNEIVFDRPSTISVRPEFQLVRGEPDIFKPYIDVRTTDPQPLRVKGIPSIMEGTPVRIRPGIIEEQIAHIMLRKIYLRLKSQALGRLGSERLLKPRNIRG
jgi:hypothetical protein